MPSTAPTSPTPEQLMTPERVGKWTNGEITLRELGGISNVQMQEMAHTAYRWLVEGRLADARVAFEGLVALEPREPYFWSALGGIHLAEGVLGMAERRCSYAIALNPGDTASYVNRGEAFARRGRIADAIADLRTALQSDPQAKNPATARAKPLIESLLQLLQSAGAKGKGAAAAKGPTKATPKAAAAKKPAPKAAGKAAASKKSPAKGRSR